MSEYDVVHKPEHMSYEEAAAGIGDCVRAYTALYYQARVCGGDTVLIIDGATAFGSVAIQLANQWGAKVKLFSLYSQLLLHPCMDLNETWQECNTLNLDVIGGHSYSTNYCRNYGPRH